MRSSPRLSNVGPWAWSTDSLSGKSCAPLVQRALWGIRAELWPRNFQFFAECCTLWSDRMSAPRKAGSSQITDPSHATRSLLVQPLLQEGGRILRTHDSNDFPPKRSASAAFGNERGRKQNNMCSKQPRKRANHINAALQVLLRAQLLRLRSPLAGFHVHLARSRNPAFLDSAVSTL